MLGGTVFPQMLGLASSFQPELAEAMTTAIRSQLLAIGARQGLAPVLDVAREPTLGARGGNFRRGPDPGQPFWDGLCAWPAIGDPGGRRHGDRQALCRPQPLARRAELCAGPRWNAGDLRDLPAPFQAAIREAGLAAVMNAYPELDGEVVAASRRFLTDLLRRELGFDGLVVSDYEAIACSTISIKSLPIQVVQRVWR